MTSISDIVEIFDHTAIILLVSTIVVFAIPIFILFPPIPVEHSDALSQTHTKLGVPPAESNLRSQTSPTHNPQPGHAARIHSLHIYPIKSCQGIELTRGKIIPKGFELDRLFTFAKLKPKTPGVAVAESAQHTPTWEILTLRQLPLLANVKVDLWLPDASKSSRLLGKVEGGFIVVRFPWRDPGVRGLMQLAAAKLSRGLSGVPEREFMLPLGFPTEAEIAAQGYYYGNIMVFKSMAYALNMEKEIPPELGLYLGAKGPVSLFRIDPLKQREVLRCAPRKADIGYQPVVDFQDAYPIHMLNLTSIRALESKVRKDQTLQYLDARRFRANIVVSGLKEYDEDDWRSVQFKQQANTNADNKFDVSCRTVRCKLPNVDPATGFRHNVEPDHALRNFRDIDEGAPKKGCFGMQLCPIFSQVDDIANHEIFLEVGMEVDVLERGAHFAL